jgi:hypothetical protein
MELASLGNPNVCAGCAQLLDDVSPIAAVLDLGANEDQRAADLKRAEGRQQTPHEEDLKPKIKVTPLSPHLDHVVG